MNHFEYRAGVLHAEDVPLPAIAAEVGTPFYCYATATLKRHIRVFREAFASLDTLICYAMKANSNQSVIRTFVEEGAGLDVVSEGELRRALAAGARPETIVFSGVAKSAREIALAIDTGILCFNVESEPELERISEIASSKGATVAIAIRVNPDVDARTHAKITTGKAENKFGVPYGEARAVYARAAKLPGIRVSGVDMHIGSQITDMEPYDAAYGRLADLVRDLRADGHDDRPCRLRRRPRHPLPARRSGPAAALGLCRDHPPPARQSRRPHPARARPRLRRQCRHPCRQRRIHQAGHGQDLRHPRRRHERPHPPDALRRPSRHQAGRTSPVLAAEPMVADVVGGICETGDYLALGRRLPPLEAGDLVAIMTAGAYGAVQGSTYNTHPLAAEVHGQRRRMGGRPPAPEL